MAMVYTGTIYGESLSQTIEKELEKSLYEIKNPLVINEICTIKGLNDVNPKEFKIYVPTNLNTNYTLKSLIKKDTLKHVVEITPVDLAKAGRNLTKKLMETINQKDLANKYVEALKEVTEALNKYMGIYAYS
ncbi:MAG: hypothetical protein QXU74_03130 [Candidatus Aenigmatarchaeota archaeon]